MNFIIFWLIFFKDDRNSEVGEADDYTINFEKCSECEIQIAYDSRSSKEEKKETKENGIMGEVGMMSMILLITDSRALKEGFA